MLLLTLLLASFASAKEPVRVGIIDTGIDESARLIKPFAMPNKKALGYDFFENKKRQMDVDGHGTHLAGVITIDQEPEDLHLYSYRFTDGETYFHDPVILKLRNKNNERRYLQSLKQAIKDKVQILNLSLMHQNYIEEEVELFKKAADQGMLVIAGAGNDKLDLDKTPSYPCAYDLPNILCVGSSNGAQDKISSFSNFGSPVKIYAHGEEVIGYSIDRKELLTTMSGTSQATAVISRLAADMKRESPELTATELKRQILELKSGVFLTTYESKKKP